jgi:hypothetical protein
MNSAPTNTIPQANSVATGPQTNQQQNSADFNMALFIQRAVQEAVSSTLLSLPNARGQFNTGPNHHHIHSGPITKKQKSLIGNNFKRIFNTAFELQRHTAYHKLAPLRIHNSANKYVELYNIQDDEHNAPQEALRTHLNSRANFLESLIKQQRQLIENLKHRGPNGSFEKIINDALNRAINESAPTQKAIWTEIFQFATNLAIFNCYEQLREAKPTAEQQQQLDESLRLGQLRSIYQRRLEDSSNHLSNGTLPGFLFKQSIRLPSNHKNLPDVQYNGIENDWQKANFEAQRLLLHAAQLIFKNQLTKTNELIDQIETTNRLTGPAQRAQVTIAKLKQLRTKVSSDPGTLPRSFEQIFANADVQITDQDQLLALYQDENNFADFRVLIDAIKANFIFEYDTTVTPTIGTHPTEPGISSQATATTAFQVASNQGPTNSTASTIDDVFDDEMDQNSSEQQSSNSRLKRNITASSSNGLSSKKQSSSRAQNKNPSTSSGTTSPQSPKPQRKH